MLYDLLTDLVAESKNRLSFQTFESGEMLDEMLHKD
jgi:hypothetical protein